MSAHVPPEVAVTDHKAPKASSPFLGHPRLITCMQDPPLMSVRAALSVRVLSKEVVCSHKAPEVAGSADVSSEVVELTSGLLNAVEPADVSSEVAELASGLLEVVEPADVSSEVAELASGLLEAVKTTDIFSEVTELSLGLLKAVESTDVSSRGSGACFRPSQSGRGRGCFHRGDWSSLQAFLKRWSPLMFRQR